MKAKIIFIAILSIFVLGHFGCTKAGLGGNATVVCYVFNSDNNGVPVNGATIYIKYGQSTPPSGNNTGYDDHKQAAANSNSVTFTSLEPGTYYLYAEGDVGTTVSQPVSGGNPFSLTHAHRNGSSNASIYVAY
jgi:hypothetical protein